MGGNVFPGVNRRYQADEYFKLVEELAPVFESISTEYNVCPAIGNKESFGDMDVLLVPYVPFSLELLVEAFGLPKNADGSYYAKRNGDSWSLIYRDFQIDLIMSKPEEYEFSRVYFGTGDRGNFVGKLAHQLGLKFGHDGLWMMVRASDSHLLGEIRLTLDPEEAEVFLDVEPMRRANTIEEVFENVAASKYFNPELFKLENNNHVARIRDKKRPNYNLLLKWCDTLPDKEWFARSKDKTIYHDMIFKAFPKAKEEFDALWKRKELVDSVREKFNGTLVSQWTGLKDQKLGEFMKYMKDSGNFSLEKLSELSLDEVQKLVFSTFMVEFFDGTN